MLKVHARNVQSWKIFQLSRDCFADIGMSILSIITWFLSVARCYTISDCLIEQMEIVSNVGNCNCCHCISNRAANEPNPRQLCCGLWLAATPIADCHGPIAGQHTTGGNLGGATTWGPATHRNPCGIYTFHQPIIRFLEFFPNNLNM